MLNFCIMPDRVEAFKKGLKSGELNPEELSNMSSKDRAELIGKYVGKDAAQRVNAEFESKLLLKNQQKGFIDWAKNVSGIKPAQRMDLIKRIKNLEKVLDPADEHQFLQDLAETRLKANVTQDEAKAIAEMSRNISTAQEKMSKDSTFPTIQDRLNYGRSVVKMEDYISDLKNETKKTTIRDVIRNPVVSVGKGIVGTAGFIKSLTASLDNSVIGRQGLKVLFTHPTVWGKNAALSFLDFARTVGGRDVMGEVRAEVASRPNALNGLYRREKLALSNTEEAFPTSLPEKIPLLGRLFKGSESAFTAFQYRTRADLMDGFAMLAEKTGGDIKGMGLVANSLTGRGNIGKLEPVANIANNLMFSPRFLKSNIDALTGQVLDYGKMGNLARKEAAKNTVKIVAGVASVLGIANAVSPGSVDFDPRSADFGKIKVGDTRFDVAGGMSGIVTLAARLLTHSTKSSSSNKITQLNQVDSKGKAVYAGQTTLDVLQDFMLNKASPAAGIVIDVLRGSDFTGNQVTFTSELKKALLPIGIQNYFELQNNPNSAPILIAVLADALGISTNTIPVANIKSGAIPEGQKTSNKSLIDIVSVYAQALGTDPETAFNRMFTGQTIKRVDNGAIIVERMSVQDSTAVKKKGNGNNPSMKLDHSIPLELGGSNDASNLKLVTTSEWASYTKVENAVGSALRSGKVSKEQAQKDIIDFKNGNIKRDDILNKYK